MEWTHKEEQDHPVDPKYNGSGWMGGDSPSYWVCHTCRGAVLLDGKKVPITTPGLKEGKEESKMKEQP